MQTCYDIIHGENTIYKAINEKLRLVPLLLLLLIAVACTRLPDAAEFKVGMRRDELLDKFGEPVQRETLQKTSGQIFGPIETFWQSVADSSTVEIWYYTANEGTVELYFVDGSATVLGVGFAPEGAVF